jgi:hypothetical protein
MSSGDVFPPFTSVDLPRSRLRDDLTMITNLPNKFPVAALQAFDFGDADAQMDRLLPDCAVPTAPMVEFLMDRKDIVLGYRGTGKSALVRLLSEGKLSFKGDVGIDSSVLTLNEEFPFRLIADLLGRNTLSQKNQKLNSRVVLTCPAFAGPVET